MLTKENLYSILLLVRAIQKLRQVHARVAQLVEHDLAKVGVAGSSPVFRSPLGISNVLVPCPDGGIGRRAGLKHQ